MPGLGWGSESDWSAAEKEDVVVAGSSIRLASAIPDSGVSRLTFDTADISNGTASDVWGSNDGSINNATTGVSGANQTYTTNEAISFSGPETYVETSTGAFSEFSLGFWVKYDAFETNYNITLDTFYPSDSHVFSFETNDGGQTLQLKTGVGGVIDIGTPSTGTWYLVGGSFSDTDEILETVLDGSVQNSTGASGTIDLSGGMRFGARGQSGSNYYANCVIDDPRWYNKRLSSTEWSNLYNTGSING